MEPHLDRARALSYGSVAALYDRFRPTYPDALVDDLIAGRPADVLDVGCGTGQVALAFLRRGVAVLGIEPDAQMAAVGSRHGVPIEISTLEAWADPLDHDASFTLVETKTYPWSRALDADEWVGMVTTFSDHQRLEPQQLAALQEALRDAIPALGGTVHVTCGTFVRLARRI